MHPRARILHIGKFYPPYMGGLETHLEVLCGELKQVADVVVMVANHGPTGRDEVLNGVPVLRVATPLTVASAPICPEMISRLKSARYDLIHIHLPNPTAVLAYLISRPRGRLVVTYHSDTVRQNVLGAAFEPLQRRLLGRSAAILATSANYLATSPVLARHRACCHVVPYGIPIQQFSSCEPARVTQVRLQYGERLILSVGRLVYYKGFEYLIQAMRQVGGRLLLVGEGPLRGKLESLARRLGLLDRVVFLGGIQNCDVVPYYHAADVFVLPSVARSEAFGIVQIEAMAAGLPVINTQLDSGVPFVSRHGLTGLTVPPADPQALAGAITGLLDDAPLRARFGQAARERAQTYFSAPVMTAQILEIYRRVLGWPVGAEQAASVGR